MRGFPYNMRENTMSRRLAVGKADFQGLWSSSRRASEDLRMQDTDIRKVAVASLVIEAVSHHEGIGHVKAAILDGDIHLPPCPLIEQDADIHIGRMTRQEVMQEVLQGVSSIDDIFDDQDMFARETVIEVLKDADFA